DRQCLFPEPCKNLIVDHSDYLNLLREIRELPGIKKVFIRSGVRYDYLMLDKNENFFNELCKHHVSGQLKVAPEHVVERVLEKMGKPGRKVYDRFTKRFYEINRKINKEQYLVPYFISSHPGSDLSAAIELAEYLRDLGYNPEQVQDFYPTPGTLSTCMYYTGLDPRNMEPVYVPKTPKEKAMQRALLQFRRPQNYELVKEALKIAGREDLIGFGKNCLIRPRNMTRIFGDGKRTASTNSERFKGNAKNQRNTGANKGNENSGAIRNSKPEKGKALKNKDIRAGTNTKNQGNKYQNVNTPTTGRKVSVGKGLKGRKAKR
ncbi:MAG: DUF3362 domain-containing protein, partial [Bacillota bacterium]|nr:DUF3362 domain-containing protein [Bacillota bacterium]